MKKVLFGYGGHAREVMVQMGEVLECYVDDEYSTEKTKPISEFDINNEVIMVTIGDSKKRKEAIDRLPKGTKFFSFIHPTAQIMDDNISIGEGSFIGANCIITTNVNIGKHALLNRGVHIGHDTTISDFFSAMPNVVISGNVKIGNYVYFGTNSSVREKITICDNVTIGLNGGVVKDINEEGIYAGLPVKRIK